MRRRVGEVKDGGHPSAIVVLTKLKNHIAHTHTQDDCPQNDVHDTNNLLHVQHPTPVHGGKGLAEKLGKALIICSLKDEGKDGLLWYSCSSILVIGLGPTRKAHLEASVREKCVWRVGVGG